LIKRIWKYQPALILFLLVSTFDFSFSKANALQVEQVAVIPLPGAMTVAVNPLSQRVYVGGDQKLYVINGQTGVIIDSVAVTEGIFSLAVNSNTDRIYAAASLEPKILVFDGTDNSFVTSVPVTGLPRGITVDPSTNRVYVTDILAEEIVMIDGISNTIEASVPIANPQDSIQVNPVTRRLYVTDGTGVLSVLDADTLSVIDTVSLPIAAAGRIAVNAFTNRIYVSNALGYTTAFVVIDGKTNEIVTTFSMDSVTNGIALNVATNRIYLVNNGLDENTNTNTGTLLIVDGEDNQIVETLPAGSAPYGVVVDPTTSQVYVINYTGSGASAAAMGTVDVHSDSSAYESSARVNYDALIAFQDVRPALNAPMRNYFTTSTPTLTWGRISWASGYEIQVAVNSSFRDIVYSDNTLNSNQLAATTTPLSDGIYYWRVRAKRSNGTWGNWSAIDRFRVEQNEA
jgi:DNA-binding beta-propeller fold protein YncE